MKWTSENWEEIYVASLQLRDNVKGCSQIAVLSLHVIAFTRRPNSAIFQDALEQSFCPDRTSVLAAPSSTSAPTFSASAEPPLPADPDGPDPTSTEQPAPGSIWDGWTTDIDSPRLVLELLVRNMLAAGPFRHTREGSPSPLWDI